MVQVAHVVPIDCQGQVDLNAWFAWLRQLYSPQTIETLTTALSYLEQYGIDQPSEFAQSRYHQGVVMAVTLSELHAEHTAVLSALLYPLTSASIIDDESIATQFGDGVVKLLKGTDKMLALQSLQASSAKELDPAKVNGLRKMLLAMIADVRVVLIKLAEVVCAMRSSKQLPQARALTLAHEIMQVYAPLANRLGIGQLKWELEDRAFQWLHPQDYSLIKQKLDMRRVDREQYIANVIETIKSNLAASGIDAQVQGRVKHIYSIWRKMQQKHLDFEGLFDVHAVRILVRDISSCYRALSMVHAQWAPISGEFDDYIASPKPNGYQSIHTVVEGPQGKSIEVQIRTFSMHEENEMGVAAHWRYKEGGGRDVSLENRINWLRSLLDWQAELAQEDGSLEVLRSQTVDERVYVFAPDGAVVDLPKGATPLDFAYHIHTDVGHRCRGAKVDNKMVPLTYQLNTGNQVEILTQSQGKPSRDWMNSDAGYLVSSRARSKVQAWFRQQDKSLFLQEGKEQLHKAVKKAHYRNVDYDALAVRFSLCKADDLYVALGSGEIKLPGVMRQLELLYAPSRDEPHESVLSKTTSAPSAQPSSLMIGGVNNLMANMAKCCKPIIGDQVVGFITQGHGVTVHRAGCQQFAKAKERSADRVIAVSWGKHFTGRFSVDLHISALQDHNVLRDITALLAAEKVVIAGMRAQSNRRRQLDEVLLTVEVHNSDQLEKIRQLIQRVRGVMEVKRL